MTKILSVDDSATMRRIIGRAVAVMGYEFLEAENGLQALDLLPQHAPDLDLIILDVNMPEMDGFETLTRIKADARYKNIPVMMVTTESDRTRIVQAIQAGAANYVTKPFNQEDLSSKIAQCLGCF
ncbi:response regulator [Holophaga foetida]|uniref:response regulator n=1 Tax=Holophaga foetida TaxID=35839 RepID=UPI0002472A5B|nr:response regulator [Holophaga foetida]